MNFELHFSSRAKTSLAAIITYVAENQSKEAARKLRTELLDVANGLAIFPRKGRLDPQSASNWEVRYVVKWNYKIIYQIIENKVIIARFCHAKRSDSSGIE